MTTPRQLADAYYIAANWHDKQAASCSAIAKDEPRLGADIREKARVAAIHHGASAAGLRMAATEALRRNLPTPRGRGLEYDPTTDAGNGF